MSTRRVAATPRAAEASNALAHTPFGAPITGSTAAWVDVKETLLIKTPFSEESEL